MGGFKRESGTINSQKVFSVEGNDLVGWLVIDFQEISWYSTMKF